MCFVLSRIADRTILQLTVNYVCSDLSSSYLHHLIIIIWLNLITIKKWILCTKFPLEAIQCLLHFHCWPYDLTADSKLYWSDFSSHPICIIWLFCAWYESKEGNKTKTKISISCSILSSPPRMICGQVKNPKLQNYFCWCSGYIVQKPRNSCEKWSCNG